MEIKDVILTAVIQLCIFSISSTADQFCPQLGCDQPGLFTQGKGTSMIMAIR